MKTRSRKLTHVWLAAVFGLAYFVMLALQLWSPKVFELVWRQVLLFVSFYAISATHWAGASAETPTKENE